MPLNPSEFQKNFPKQYEALRNRFKPMRERLTQEGYLPQIMPPTKLEKDLRRYSYVPGGLNFVIRHYHSQSQNLGGILDTIKEVAAPYIASGGAKLKAQFQEQLNSAQMKLEAKIGDFLTTGQTLVDLKARSQAQQNSEKAEVKSRAIAITAKANALLNNYTNIKSDALALVQQIISLKNQIGSSEVFKFDNPAQMGSRVVELFNQYKSLLAKTLAESAKMGIRIENHIKETNNLKSDVSSLESYAQGKGWQSALSSFGGGVTGILSPVVKIATVGLLVYFLAPGLVRKMVRR